MPIKKDAASILGKPVTEKMPGMRYEYAPKEDAHDRILVTFERDTGIIKTINPYFKEKQTKQQFVEQFHLNHPDKIAISADGNLVEYYLPQGISLHYDGPDDSFLVARHSFLSSKENSYRTAKRRHDVVNL